MFKIIEINISKRTLLAKASDGRMKCLRKESKFLRHLPKMLETNHKEIPSLCFMDYVSLDNIDILDIDGFVVYDEDREEIVSKSDTIKFSLEDMKFVNVRRKVWI